MDKAYVAKTINNSYQRKPLSAIATRRVKNSTLANASVITFTNGCSLVDSFTDKNELAAFFPSVSHR